MVGWPQQGQDSGLILLIRLMIGREAFTIRAPRRHPESSMVEPSSALPKLVLIHGWGMNTAVWQPLAELLQPKFQLQLLELPSCNAHAQSEYSLEQLASAALAEVGPGAHWLGWSLGAMVATAAALMPGTQARSLTWLAGTPRFVADEGWNGVDGAVLAAFRAALSCDPVVTIDRFLGLQCRGSQSMKSDLRFVRQCRTMAELPPLAWLASGLDLLRDLDLRGALKRLSCPLWRYYGGQDALIPVPADTQILIGQQRVFAASAHLPFVSEAEAVAAALTTDLLG